MLEILERFVSYITHILKTLATLFGYLRDWSVLVLSSVWLVERVMKFIINTYVLPLLVVATLVLFISCRVSNNSVPAVGSSEGGVVECELPETSAVRLRDAYEPRKAPLEGAQISYKVTIQGVASDHPRLIMETASGGVRPALGLRAQRHQSSVDYTVTINPGFSENYELYLPDEKLSGQDANVGSMIYTQIFHSDEGDHFYSAAGVCVFKDFVGLVEP